MRKETIWKVFTLVCAAVLGVCRVCPVAFAADEKMYPNKVKTHIGTLTFDHGIPTEETSEKLYYELDYHRAVQAYLWSLPIVGQAQWRQSYLDLYNMNPNQVVYLTQFNDRSLILTANESTPYLIGWTNVKDKAAVVEIPAAAVIGLSFVAVIWLSTFVCQVPAHERLSKQFDPRIHRRLVRSNWLRTAVWSARGAVVCWLCLQVFLHRQLS